MKYRELVPFEDEYVRLLRPKGLKTYRQQNQRIFETPKRDQRSGILQQLCIEYPVPEHSVDWARSNILLGYDREDDVLRIATIIEPDEYCASGFLQRVTSEVNKRLGESSYTWDAFFTRMHGPIRVEMQASGFFEEDEPVWRAVLESITTLR